MYTKLKIIFNKFKKKTWKKGLKRSCQSARFPPSSSDLKRRPEKRDWNFNSLFISIFHLCPVFKKKTWKKGLKLTVRESIHELFQMHLKRRPEKRDWNTQGQRFPLLLIQNLKRRPEKRDWNTIKLTYIYASFCYDLKRRPEKRDWNSFWRFTFTNPLEPI